MSSILALIIATIAEIAINAVFGKMPILEPYTITLNIVFITALLVTYKDKLLPSILFTLVVGTIVDLYNPTQWLLLVSIYTMCMLIVRLWSQLINYSIVEMTFTILAAVLIKEIMMYLYYTMVVGVDLNFNVYVLTFLTPTLIINLMITIICVIIKKIIIEKDIYQQRRQGRRGSFDNRY
ncbi:MAG: hypothetical protein GX760_01185 [Erysipelothrix sp.]|nr:hypothetical protein [Erysipelothrix sp.]